MLNNKKNHQIFHRFLDMICLAIHHHLVMKNHIFCFFKISLFCYILMQQDQYTLKMTTTIQPPYGSWHAKFHDLVQFFNGFVSRINTQFYKFKFLKYQKYQRQHYLKPPHTNSNVVQLDMQRGVTVIFF